MKTISLHDQFHSWLLSTYKDPEFAGKVHCFAVRKNVPLAADEVLDFVSVCHERAALPKDRGVFSVGIWKFTPGEIGLDDISEMCRHIQAFRSGCAEMVNQLEMKGEMLPIAIALHGNLVGASVAPNEVASLLANGLSDLFFWTYRRGINRVEVEPHLDDGAVADSCARLLRTLFEHSPRADGGRRSPRMPVLA